MFHDAGKHLPRGIYSSFTLVFLLWAGVMLFPAPASAVSMQDYCVSPPSITSPVAPNVLFVVDVSGSMTWRAYSGNYTGEEEGYFIPDKVYIYNYWGDYWEESNSTPSQCPETKEQIDPSKAYRGSCLNFLLMSRIDLLRWALTGGKPASCGNSPQINRCDPEVYRQPNAQVSCDDYGCILESSSGWKVKVPWSRIYDALLFRFKDLSLKPRVGVMFYSGTGVVDKVYIGDFTASASFDAVNPYKNTITHLNWISPSGATPTAPALWDAYNYFAQNSPEYGGFTPQTGTGDVWKNPLYQCFDENDDGNCQGNELKLVSCAKNFVVLLSDGQWNRGGYPVRETCSIDYPRNDERHSADPVVPAYWLHKIGFTNAPTGVSSRVEAVYAIGLFLGGTGEQSLKNVAMYGSFDLTHGDWPGDLAGYPQDTCWMDDCSRYTHQYGKGSACTPLPASSSDWDKDGNAVPDTFFKASNARQIREVIWEAIQDILRRASSGTAAAMLASSEGSGALLAQAAFYPRRSLGGTEINWTGELQLFWYYLDPWQRYSTIREETPPQDLILDLSKDYIVHFEFDGTKTIIKRYIDTDGDGVADSYAGSQVFEEANSLFRAGELLCSENASSRTIYTNVNGTLVSFDTSNLSILCPYLLQGSCTNSTLAEQYIRWVRGEDLPGFRSRSVSCGVWKLGDIVSSTPRIQSPIPLNSYHLKPPVGYLDNTYRLFVESNAYQNQTGFIYTGANDGMLHAFYAGILKTLFSGTQKAQIEIPSGSAYSLGEEAWAFIPQNVLPYLQYLSDLGYCHLFLVDAPPVLLDASIGGDNCTGNYWDCVKTQNSWRTVLLGGMGLGGATSENCTANGTCVPTPMPGLGYSAYFALDVTDPSNPELLWEFSHPELGFTTSGPVVVRVGESGKNGRWFVLLPSGPTGKIENQNFTGDSDQNLKIFVLDLKTGECLIKDNQGNCTGMDTGISQAFAGTARGAVVDLERYYPGASGFYSDDAVYIGYTQKVVTGNNTSWKGGVLRILINDDPDPSHWKVQKVIEGTGPVTAAVDQLLDRRRGNLWLYFGTGRYFYRGDTPDAQQALYGVKDPCYDSNRNEILANCTQVLTIADLDNRTADSANSTLWNEPPNGWYINLDPSNSTYGAERVISNPLAAFNGVVYFTTFAPSEDLCKMGGESYIWAVKYNTGGSAASLAQVKILLQLSTAAIEEINLPEELTQRGGRRTSGKTGIPSGEASPIVGKPYPVRRVIHVQEK